MDVLDGFILAACLAAAWMGSHMGFVRQACVSFGFLVGCVCAALTQNFITTLENAPSNEITFWALLALTLLITGLLFDVGYTLGNFLYKEISGFKKLRVVDTVGGAALASATVLLVIFLWAGLIARSPNRIVAAQLNDSIVLSTIRHNLNGWLPTTFVRAANLLDAHAVPQVFVGAEVKAGIIRSTASSQTVANVMQKVADSVVRITAQGCGGTSTGSGFVTGEGLVATNAHVVSGSSNIIITDKNGLHDATLVAFDPNLDLALLHAPNLAGPKLTLTEPPFTEDLPTISLGYESSILQAHTGTISDAVWATGYDIYNQGKTTRHVYILHDTIAHGDSGGPLLTAHGDLIGMIFAKSTDQTGVGYALASDQLRPYLAPGDHYTQAISSGACGTYY